MHAYTYMLQQPVRGGAVRGLLSEDEDEVAPDIFVLIILAETHDIKLTWHPRTNEG
jgi:hypothetical protein